MVDSLYSNHSAVRIRRPAGQPPAARHRVPGDPSIAWPPPLPAPLPPPEPDLLLLPLPLLPLAPPLALPLALPLPLRPPLLALLLLPLLLPLLPPLPALPAPLLPLFLLELPARVRRGECGNEALSSEDAAASAAAATPSPDGSLPLPLLLLPLLPSPPPPLFSSVGSSNLHVGHVLRSATHGRILPRQYFWSQRQWQRTEAAGHDDSGGDGGGGGQRSCDHGLLAML